MMHNIFLVLMITFDVYICISSMDCIINALQPDEGFVISEMDGETKKAMCRKPFVLLSIPE